MISKNKSKYLQSLSQKKQRLLHKEFLIEGEKLVLEALQNNWKIKEVYAVLDFNQAHEELLATQNVVVVSEKELNQIGNLANNSKAAALVEMQDFSEDNSWQHQFVLVLDQINDPGNLGTIIRTANWFGITTIICSENTVDCYNPKVIQASMGGIFSTRIQYHNLNEFLQKAAQIKDYQILGAYLEGSKLSASQAVSQGCLVLGSESHGISEDLQAFIREKITIPKGENGKMESLNVGVACGIMCLHLSPYVS